MTTPVQSRRARHSGLTDTQRNDVQDDDLDQHDREIAILQTGQKRQESLLMTIMGAAVVTALGVIAQLVIALAKGG